MLKTKKLPNRQYYSKSDVYKEYHKLVKEHNKEHRLRDKEHIRYKTEKQFLPLLKKYLEAKVEVAVKYGSVTFGRRTLFRIKRKVSTKGVEWDKKWNGYDYYGQSGHKKYQLSKAVMELIYKKVKDNWMCYG